MAGDVAVNSDFRGDAQRATLTERLCDSSVSDPASCMLKSERGEVRERQVSWPTDAIRAHNTASVHVEQLARVAPILRDRAYV